MPSSRTTSSRVTPSPLTSIEKAFAKQVALMSPQKKLELYSVSLDNQIRVVDKQLDQHVVERQRLQFREG
jgi:hypothetical protein